MDNDETRLSDTDTTHLAPSGRTEAVHSGADPSSGSGHGWLSSSGSIDHGRFPPGTLLENRYRIIGLLGRGGMGEVYRADDLRLGQQVALKFLPESLSRDAQRLAQFHNEVRTARQVSHPNVCRVYDIGDADVPSTGSGQGQLFLTMEYVDGEDLSSLLRRIGRLPEDKAVEIARQICAGLAAAHERGVLHRDLKPANIMLDGAGKVRLMDFSLAAVGAVTDIRAGTPAYMAPEQLAGKEVTVRSDIYALGLVLYELFTGRRAFDAKTIAELVEQHQSGTITAPTELVKTLDPTIERAILRCLDPDPKRRPASALAVAAALPGGDPLAAALAAGETPSPEMVAAAGGETAALSARAGFLWLSVVAVCAIIATLLASRYALIARVPLSKPSAVLADRAEEIRETFGYMDAVVDEASGFQPDGFYLHWADTHGAGDKRWPDLPSGRPAAVKFWYRTSPRVLAPVNRVAAPSPGDPPLLVTGMTIVQIDTKGRLLSFEAMPPQVDPSTAPPFSPVDWSAAFAAAGVDRAAMTEVRSERTPQVFADERHAWQGTWPGTAITLRIEAAGYRGRPVWFDLVWPWSYPTREASVADNDGNSVFSVVLILTLLTISAVLTRANIRSGRADRRGAFRLAAFTFFMMMAIWLVGPHVRAVPEEEQRLVVGLGIALFLAGALYTVYLALEPFVRKSWPTMLIAWSRLMSGRVRDPLIGRDVLIGIAGGAALALLDGLSAWLPRAIGWAEPVPAQSALAALDGLRGLSQVILACVNTGLQNGLLITLELAMFRELVRRVSSAVRVTRAPSDRLVGVLAMLIMTVLTAVDTSTRLSHLWLPALVELLSLGVILWVMLRVGLVAACVMYLVDFLIDRAPLTLDGSKFYAGEGWAVLGLIFGAAAWGMWLARGGSSTSDLSPPHSAR